MWSISFQLRQSNELFNVLAHLSRRKRYCNQSPSFVVRLFVRPSFHNFIEGHLHLYHSNRFGPQLAEIAEIIFWQLSFKDELLKLFSYNCIEPRSFIFRTKLDQVDLYQFEGCSKDSPGTKNGPAPGSQVLHKLTERN